MNTDRQNQISQVAMNFMRQHGLFYPLYDCAEFLEEAKKHEITPDEVMDYDATLALRFIPMLLKEKIDQKPKGVDHPKGRLKRTTQ